MPRTTHWIASGAALLLGFATTGCVIPPTWNPPAADLAPRVETPAPRAQRHASQDDEAMYGRVMANLAVVQDRKRKEREAEEAAEREREKAELEERFRAMVEAGLLDPDYASPDMLRNLHDDVFEDWLDDDDDWSGLWSSGHVRRGGGVNFYGHYRQSPAYYWNGGYSYSGYHGTGVYYENGAYHSYPPRIIWRNRDNCDTRTTNGLFGQTRVKSQCRDVKAENRAKLKQTRPYGNAPTKGNSKPYQPGLMFR
jgi:hypothetical protein